MEIPLLLVAAFVVLVFMLWRNRTGGSGEQTLTPGAPVDRPDLVDTIETARVHIGHVPGPGGSITGIGGGGIGGHSG